MVELRAGPSVEPLIPVPARVDTVQPVKPRVLLGEGERVREGDAVPVTVAGAEKVEAAEGVPLGVRVPVAAGEGVPVGELDWEAP